MKLEEVYNTPKKCEYYVCFGICIRKFRFSFSKREKKTENCIFSGEHLTDYKLWKCRIEADFLSN